MYNYHGHPWANILNPKEPKTTFRSPIQNISEKISEEESKEEKYLNDFFQQINKAKDEELKKSKNLLRL